MTEPEADEAMGAEFDTVARWTAEVALDLGPDHRLPAACRGSGSPSALRWFVDRLELGSEDRLLDCGAGVGGPAAFARQETGIRPVLSEPEFGACQAARTLFDLPVVQAASTLPFQSGCFDAAWSLGVLCTVGDQPLLLAELARVLRPGGRLGLLVFVATTTDLSRQPVGNHFPTEAGLGGLLWDAGFTALDSATTAEFPCPPGGWQDRADEVERELACRHGRRREWRLAEEQSRIIGDLLASGQLVGRMLYADRS